MKQKKQIIKVTELIELTKKEMLIINGGGKIVWRYDKNTKEWILIIS